MKKYIASVCLAFLLAAGGNVLPGHELLAEAAYELAWKDGSLTTYVDTGSIRTTTDGYHVRVSMSGKTNKYMLIKFYRQGMSWKYRSAYSSGYVNQNDWAKSVDDICRPYL